MQHHPDTESGQMDMPRRDVLAKISGGDAKPERVELKDKFLFQKRNLPQIGAARVFRLLIKMLDRGAPMRVAFNAEALDQRDRTADLFAKAMPARRGDGGHQRHVARGRFLFWPGARRFLIRRRDPASAL